MNNIFLFVLFDSLIDNVRKEKDEYILHSIK